MVEQTSITREKIIDQHPHVINESPGDRTYVESTDSIDDEFYDAGLSEKELKEKIKNPGSFDYGEYASQMNLENMDDTHQPLFAPVHEDKREQTNQLDKTGNLQSSNPGSPVVSGPKTESKGIPFNYHDSDDDE